MSETETETYKQGIAAELYARMLTEEDAQAASSLEKACDILSQHEAYWWLHKEPVEGCFGTYVDIPLSDPVNPPQGVHRVYHETDSSCPPWWEIKKDERIPFCSVDNK